MLSLRSGFIAGCLFIFLCELTLAQNVRRVEEEAIKDKEREAKIQDYLKKKEEEKRILSQPVTPEEIENKNLVEVESSNVLPSDLASDYALVPYKMRRLRWGQEFTLTYSQYNPINFESDFVSPSAGKFDSLYGSAQSPLLEISYTYKWNFIFGSLGGEVAYGTYKNEASDTVTLGDAVLSLQMARIGVKYVADNIFYEPIVAPYIMAGAYSAFYKETQANVTHDGTAAVAIYYGTGLMYQLGALDNSAATDGYLESGIENTFIFAETRQYLASSSSKDPDFSTDLDLNFGLTIEF